MISSQPAEASEEDPNKKLSKKEKKEAKKREKELKKIAKEQQQARDYLTREFDFTGISTKRGWDDFELWCDGIKLSELREDVGKASQSANFLLDKAQNAIDVVKTHRSHAEEQYLRNFQNHSSLIDYIMKIFKLYQESAEQLYENEREHLISDFFKEANFRDSVHHNRNDYYGNFINAAVSLTKCRLHEAKEKFIERKFEIESASVVDRENAAERAMKSQVVACAEIRSLVNYFNKTLWPKERFDKYQASMKKTIKDETTIEHLKGIIESSLRTIGQLKNEMKSVELKKLSKTAKLKSEYQFMNKMMLQHKEELASRDLLDKKLIEHLVSVCDETKKYLKTKLEKMELIKTTMRICLKLEKLSDRNFESSEDFIDPEQFLFKKLSQVEAECVLLRNFKKKYLFENEILKSRIEQESHELGVRQNLAMLRLDTSPSVGTIVQVSHQIHQIKSSISLRNRFKLCKDCKNHLAL